MSNNQEQNKTEYRKYVMAVSTIGLAGLVTSVYLLMDYKEPLLNVWKLILNSIFG